MRRLIIDTDPGVDDAHAILLALAYPDVKVEAITTVNGNVGLDLTTANALKILDAAGKQVPVYPRLRPAADLPLNQRSPCARGGRPRGLRHPGFQTISAVRACRPRADPVGD